MRKHSGWYKNYLLFAVNRCSNVPALMGGTVAGALACHSIGTRVIKQLRSLGQLHARFSIYRAVSQLAVYTQLYPRVLYPANLGMSVFFNLNLLRNLALRQYKIRRLLVGYPVRGQRSWSNANTSRKCCSFFKQSVSAYERELWGYSQPKKKRTLTRLDEVRFDAKHRVVQKKRFVTKKIKTRKELVLRRKKRKKTP